MAEGPPTDPAREEADGDEWQRVRRVKKAVEDDLLALPGVVGVDVGRKIVDGVKTEIVAIRVYVEQKAPASGPRALAREELVPVEIEGVPTDVVERRFHLH